MSKIIQEIQVLGPISIFAHYLDASTLILEAQENYQKKSHRNRYKISGPNGIINLSIPLQKGKNQKTPIKEVKISYDEHWVSNHIHTIQTCYGNAPFFIYYSGSLFDILKKKHKFLWDLNLELLQILLRLLQINIAIEETTDYQTTYTAENDLRNKYKINARDNFPIQPYAQVFEEKYGFIPGLSILDLLFCTGPEAVNYLRRDKSLPKNP